MPGAIEAALTLLAGKGASGTAFYDIAARALGLGLGVRWAAVARLAASGDAVETLAFCADGESNDSVSYLLASTPCKEIYDRADAEHPECMVVNGVCERFPDDQMLVDLGAQSYRGELFYDVTGTPVGHVFVLDDKPMSDAAELSAFFRLVTQRVGSEFNRRAAERALLDSEARLRHAARLAHLGYWVWDELQDRAIYASDELGHLYGYADGAEYRRQLNSATAHRRFVHPDDVERYQEADDRSIRENVPIDLEYRTITRTGEVRYIKEVGEPVLDEIGRRVRTSGVVQDITEQRNAALELEETTARLRRAAQLAQLGYWVWDEVHDRSIYCSDELAKIFGFETGAELTPVLSSPEIDLSFVHAEDRARYAATGARGRENRESFSIEYRIVTRRGEVRHVREITEHIVDDDDQLIRTNGVVQDITELKRARDELIETRAQLGAIADHSPALIGFKDRQGRYVFTNKEFERIHEVPAGWFLGKTVFEVFPREVAEAFHDHDVEVLRTLRVVQREQWTPQHKVVLMEVKFPIFDAVGEPVGVGLIGTDITESKRVETALVDAKVEAEEATQAKSRFLASMSHELRTPLNAIIGITEMLQEDTDEQRYDGLQEGLGRISGAGKHLLSLINDILDLSKIEANRVELLPEVFDVATLVDDVAMTARALADKNDNVLETHTDTALQAMEADPLRVRQIIFNLLSNACKFTHSGEIHLDVWPEGTGISGWVYFRIRDNGVGIASAQMKTLFHEFTQARGADRREGGTGLGLAITHRLCKLMGGDIEVSSSLGTGSTFSVRLPQSCPPV